MIIRCRRSPDTYLLFFYWLLTPLYAILGYAIYGAVQAIAQGELAFLLSLGIYAIFFYPLVRIGITEFKRKMVESIAVDEKDITLSIRQGFKSKELTFPKNKVSFSFKRKSYMRKDLDKLIIIHEDGQRYSIKAPDMFWDSNTLKRIYADLQALNFKELKK